MTTSWPRVRVMGPERGTAHRLHPASLPLELVRRLARFGFLALAAIVLAAKSEEVLYLFLLLLPVLGAVVRYATFRYELADDRLIVRAGLFVKQVRQIPYARIQNLDTTEGLLHRALGVVVVRVQTAGGKEPEAEFRVISRARFEELRSALFEARAPSAPDARAWSSDAVSAPVAEGDVPWSAGSSVRGSESLGTTELPFFRMSAGDLAVHGLLSQKGLFVIVGAFFALREFAGRERLEQLVESGVERVSVEASTVGPWTWFALALVFVVLLQIGTLAWTAVTLAGFRLERRGDALHSAYGLFTRHEASLTRARIQALHVKQNLLQRVFRRVSVHAVSAGGVGGEEKEHARPWLVPACREELLPRILAEVQPETDFDAVAWLAVHPRAPRRIAILGTLQYGVLFGALATLAHATDFAPAGVAFGAALALAVLSAIVRARLTHRNLGYGRTEKALYLRRGVLTRRRSCVRYEKIQSVRVHQSPLDRRARMAHVAIDTAGPGGSDASFVVPYLGVRDARRLCRELTSEANRRDFRW